MRKKLLVVPLLLLLLFACNEKDPGPGNNTMATFKLQSWDVDGISGLNDYNNVAVRPVIRFRFSAPVDRAAAQQYITLRNASGSETFQLSFEQADSTAVLRLAALKEFTTYKISVPTSLKAANGATLDALKEINLTTGLDTTDKFSRISDSALLDLVQKQTFRYFWDFGHPVSGLARERNTSGETVTSGGSGFGVMSLIVAIHRSFITRAEGLARVQKIVGFLKSNAQKFKGAFPHWLNGTTGVVVPFSAKDNGADLVETSFLMQGLLTARQYFNGADAAETALRADINLLWQAVEWNWFRRGTENVLYWHWSPDYAWDMNHKIEGWNECLITYLLAAGSPTYSIPKEVYDQGWARSGAMRNGNMYYGLRLPLGPPLGGPLFFSHYSFLGLNPQALTDNYANYWDQNKNHSLINHRYCIANPKGFVGYSDQCWGLTASDDNKTGYAAHEPNNDNGVISPTAALSSFTYTPEESMKALHFFYYKLGDKIWKDYGFVDAFNLTDRWYANSFLAIDQGPIIVMIENYRTGLLWKLFMSCPEVKTGLRNLGFSSPFL
jgi:hypothetical protein